MLREEKKFCHEKEINYIFKKASWDSPYLVVVFSGFNSAAYKEQHPYNYITALSKFDLNLLFIQDTCGERGCYYLCEHLNFSVERTVYALIKKIANEAGVEEKNIITVGSSKGGTAAIYYGLKYAFGHVIAGVPQTKLASYIVSTGAGGKPVRDYMFAQDDWDNSFEILDEIVLNLVKENLPTKVNLLLSENDSLWNEHFVPLLQKFDQMQVQYEMVNDLSIKKHSEVAVAFPGYLRDKLLAILMGHKVDLPVIEEMGNNTFAITPGSVEWQCSVNSECEEYLVSSTEQKRMYDFSGVNDDIVEVRVQGDCRCKDRIVYTEVLYENIFPMDALQISGCQLEIKGNLLHADILVTSKMDLKYAFYLYEDGVRIHILGYSDDKQAVFEIQEKKTYRVHYFIKTPQGRAFCYQSKKIAMGE